MEVLFVLKENGFLVLGAILVAVILVNQEVLSILSLIQQHYQVFALSIVLVIIMAILPFPIIRTLSVIYLYVDVLIVLMEMQPSFFLNHL